MDSRTLVRLAAAAIQALALVLLTEAATLPRTWPATDLPVFYPLLLISIYTPLLAMAGCGSLKPPALASWVAGATLVLALLGWHEAARGTVPPWPGPPWPRFQLWLAVSGALFVAHVLVSDAVVERRLLATYPRHFDTAWKLGLQAVLSAGFVGVFWIILELGAELFRLIDITVFTRLLRHDWFYIPATTLALALSIHVTDVQPGLIRGTRGIVLSLFSWLLPLLAIILAGFLCSLPLISLHPLWHTHFAASLLLTAAGLLIFLINTAYQDGTEKAGRLKRWAAALGAIATAPLVGLAVWAVALRVEQYGWTVQRIEATAVAFVLGCHAAGYLAAALRSPRHLRWLEITNVLSAVVAVAVVVLLFSPAADSSRLMVASQMGELKSGAIPPEKFDFTAVHFDGARWGTVALQALAHQQDPASAAVAAKAKEALAATTRTRFAVGIESPMRTEEEIEKSIRVLPAGRTLPPDFFAKTAEHFLQNALSMCVPQKCVARYMALKPGAEESLVLMGPFFGYVLDRNADGTWHETAQVQGSFACKQVGEARDAGALAPQPHALPDLIIGGKVFVLIRDNGTCDPRDPD